MKRKKMINGIMIFYLFLLFPISASATFTYYESFEADVVDTVFPAPGSDCSDYFYNGYNFPTENCSSHIRNTFTARYGTQYLDATCDFVDASPTECNESQRTHIVYGRPSGWSPCNQMKTDDNTEYWIAWSNYIPADYYVELYSHLIFQILANNKAAINIYYGGGYGGGAYAGATDYDGAQWKNGVPTFASYGGLWADDMGTWVDWVLHVVWYSTTNANAVMELYRNGNLVYSNYGLSNYKGSGYKPIMVFNDYNTTNSTAAYGDDACVERTRIGRDQEYPMVNWRRVPIDEIRITEDTIGTKGYCDVAQPIWAAKPAISYPTQNQNNMLTSVPTTFTVTYSDYTEARTDPQNCFSYTKSQVQVDESGGDWSILVYDSGEITDESSHLISGLANSTEYQIRVRHKSARKGSTDVYWGQWSSIVTFTTGSGSEVEAPNPPGNPKIVVPLLPDKY